MFLEWCLFEFVDYWIARGFTYCVYCVSMLAAAIRLLKLILYNAPYINRAIEWIPSTVLYFLLYNQLLAINLLDKRLTITLILLSLHIHFALLLWIHECYIDFTTLVLYNIGDRRIVCHKSKEIISINEHCSVRIAAYYYCSQLYWWINNFYLSSLATKSNSEITLQQTHIPFLEYGTVE